MDFRVKIHDLSTWCEGTCVVVWLHLCALSSREDKFGIFFFPSLNPAVSYSLATPDPCPSLHSEKSLLWLVQGRAGQGNSL